MGIEGVINLPFKEFPSQLFISIIAELRTVLFHYKKNFINREKTIHFTQSPPSAKKKTAHSSKGGKIKRAAAFEFLRGKKKY